MNNDIDLLVNIKKALFHKRVIAATTAVFAIGSIVFALLSKPVYLSTSSLLPTKNNEQTSGLSSMAAMFGVSLNTTSSPLDNIPQLLASPLFLDTLTKIKWRTVGTDALRTLEEISPPEVFPNPKAPHVTREMLIEQALAEQLLKNIDYVSMGNVKQLNVMASDPYLAHDMNEFLLGYIDAYINASRQTSRRHQLQFIEERLEEYKQALSKSENALNRFQKQNRVISDPDLHLQEQRLQRELKVNENIVYELRKQLETALIGVEREIEVIEIFQEPNLPMWPIKPKRKIIAAAGTMGGFFAGLCLSFLLCWWKENKDDLVSRWKRPYRQ